MTSEIILRPRAGASLEDIPEIIAQDDPRRGLRFVDRLRTVRESLARFTERGRQRDDLGTGVRALAVHRRVPILYRVAPAGVMTLDIARSGRDIGAVPIED